MAVSGGPAAMTDDERNLLNYVAKCLSLVMTATEDQTGLGQKHVDLFDLIHKAGLDDSPPGLTVLETTAP
jgi:hypothetical protein